MGCGASSDTGEVPDLQFNTSQRDGSWRHGPIVSSDDVSMAMVRMYRELCMRRCTPLEVSKQVTATAATVTRAHHARLYWPTTDGQLEKLVCLGTSSNGMGKARSFWDSHAPSMVDPSSDGGPVSKTATTQTPTRVRIHDTASSKPSPPGMVSKDDGQSDQAFSAVLTVPIMALAFNKIEQVFVGVLEATREGDSIEPFGDAEQEALALMAVEISALVDKQSAEVFRMRYGCDVADEALQGMLTEFGAGPTRVANIKRAKRKLRVAAKLISSLSPKRGPVAGPRPVAPPAKGVPSLQELKTWGMPVLDLDMEQMAYCFQACLQDLGFLTEFKVAPLVAYNYAMKIFGRYQDTPYHNMHHGFMVFQGVYMLIAKSDEGQDNGPIARLDFLDKFVVLVAALAHDAGHNGVNNAFHIQSSSELALTYNDQSPLEMYHVQSGFEVMKEPDSNMFGKLTEVQRVTARKLMIESILHTDMKLHGDVEKLLRDTVEFADTAADHQHITNVLLHAVDLNNVAVGWDVAQDWAVRVGQEFNNQYNDEVKLGITPSAFMKVPNNATLAKLQIGYISFVARPFFKLVTKHFSQFEMALDHVNSNLEKWNERKAALEAAEPALMP